MSETSTVFSLLVLAGLIVLFMGLFVTETFSTQCFSEFGVKDFENPITDARVNSKDIGKLECEGFAEAATINAIILIPLSIALAIYIIPRFIPFLGG